MDAFEVRLEVAKLLLSELEYEDLDEDKGVMGSFIKDCDAVTRWIMTGYIAPVAQKE